jgi:hypothetical protein
MKPDPTSNQQVFDYVVTYSGRLGTEVNPHGPATMQMDLSANLTMSLFRE